MIEAAGGNENLPQLALQCSGVSNKVSTLGCFFYIQFCSLNEEYVMSADDLLRSYSQENASSAGRVSSLVGKPEGDLYALLASRASMQDAGSVDLDDRFRTSYDTDELNRGPAIELGKRIFARCSRAAHDFCCNPSGEDKELRDKMLNAIFSKEGGGVALLAGGLVAAIGLSPAVAALVAALLVKLIIAPTAAEVCSAWGEALKL